MPKKSAGLLMYKLVNNELKLFIAHPGGPFWKDKNEGTWGIPKGEIEEGEEPFSAAKREFKEETGISAEGDFMDLESVRQKSGKIIHCWAFKGDWSGLLMGRSFVDLEYPSKSGKFIKFPEIEKAGFFSVEETRKKINPAQFEFVERLKKKLNIK